MGRDDRLAGEEDCGDLILVADGDAACRSLIVALLRRVGHKTREAATGQEVLNLVESSRPALVLIDVELPGISGYETCRELRDRFGEEIPVVFVSETRVEAIDRIAGLLIGADDYIVKPFEPDELLGRVRLLLRRHNGNPARPEKGDAVSIDTLTARERQVLTLLSQGRSQREIAQEFFISPKTVATHIQRVLMKLNVHSRAQAVAFAHLHGLPARLAPKAPQGRTRTQGRRLTINGLYVAAHVLDIFVWAKSGPHCRRRASR